MGSSRQEYWSVLPCPPPEALPDPGTEPVSPASPALAGGFLYHSATLGKPYFMVACYTQEGVKKKKHQTWAFPSKSVWPLNLTGKISSDQ